MEMQHDFSIHDAMRLASSPAGKQLIALLQQQGGNEFRKAMASAASGDYSQAKLVIETLMADPQAQKLLKDLGG